VATERDSFTFPVGGTSFWGVRHGYPPSPALDHLHCIILSALSIRVDANRLFRPAYRYRQSNTRQRHLNSENFIIYVKKSTHFLYVESLVSNENRSCKSWCTGERRSCLISEEMKQVRSQKAEGNSLLPSA
jgi:hypothetical protein